MSLFKPAKNESAFLKMGLMGNAGSGKTLTSCLTAIGLITHCRTIGLEYAKKPVFFLDSENGSDYVQDLFEEAGIELQVLKSKSFKDLCATMPEAEKHASLLIIDSVSAFWDEWKKTYQRTKGRTRLQFEDFGYIKDQWREGFTDRFINSKLHCIMCGRLAYEWDYSVDEETGKKNLEKTDVKMAAEKELGYESSLFAMMERDRNMKTNEVVRTVTILKDRFRAIDGQTFENPSYKTFAPHILKLNLAGSGAGIDLTRSSADMVPPDPKRENTAIRRKICLDYINTLLDEYGAGGTSKEAKEKRIALLKTHFKTVSKTEIEELMSLRDLESAYDSLHVELTSKHSHYWKEQEQPVSDEIPFLEPAPQSASPAGEAAQRLETGGNTSETERKSQKSDAGAEEVARVPEAESTRGSAEEKERLVSDDEPDDPIDKSLADYQASLDIQHNASRVNAIAKHWKPVIAMFDPVTQARFSALHAQALARVKQKVVQAAE